MGRKRPNMLGPVLPAAATKNQIKTKQQQEFPPEQEPSPKRKRVECDICKKVFQGSNALNNHVASKHSTPGIKGLGNNVGKVFPTKGLVNLSGLIPIGDKPNGCQVCGKAFATGKQLAQHVQSHTGGKPAYTFSNSSGSLTSENRELPVGSNLVIKDLFVSGNHDKKSVKRLQLRVRQRVHSGKRPYRCELCKHSFASRTELKLHTKRHTSSQRSHLKKKSLGNHQFDCVVESDVQGGANLKHPNRPRISDDGLPIPPKYWNKRHSYFSLYNEGIRLDLESWYSVTPEKIAQHHAARMACDVIIDAFCGAGGNTIQFAKTCKHVIAIDIDPAKIEMAKHNAAIYRVDHKVDFIVGDFLKLALTLSADVVFLSPPWGGPDYKKRAVFDLETMLIPVSIHELMAFALKISPNVAAFLPKNSNTDVLSGETAGNRLVEIEENKPLEYKSPIAITAYFGDLANLDLEPPHHQAIG